MKPAFDDSALPSELREELARSRSAGHDYDTLGKLPQLKAALAAAQANAYDPLAEPGSASPVHVPAAAWKLTLLAAALGAAFYSVWPAPERPAVPAEPPRAQQRIAPPSAAEPASPVVEREAAKPSAPAPEQLAPSTQPQEPSARREIAQLVRIRALLKTDPAAAYRLALRSDQEFPRGVLREERRALQVVALANRGSLAAAQRAAQAFFDQYPHSPLRDLVTTALAR